MKDVSILWRRLKSPGHEYARLSQENPGWLLAGAAAFQHEQQACMLEYTILCDKQWHTRSGRVCGWVGNTTISIEIAVDDRGTWRMNGRPLPLARFLSLLSLTNRCQPMTPRTTITSGTADLIIHFFCCSVMVDSSLGRFLLKYSMRSLTAGASASLPTPALY